MDKNQAVKMGEEVMAAAEKIAAKYGMTVKRGSGKYDAESYKLNNITFYDTDDNSTDNAPKSRFTPKELRSFKYSFDMYKDTYGLGNVTVGQIFTDTKGRDMKVLGWKSRNRKYPILIQSVNNPDSVYKVTAGNLKLEMNA